MPEPHVPEALIEDPLPEEAEAESSRWPEYIVGIGASAGGLEALEQLFEKMPSQTGLAFVVVQHLSPDFKSLTDVLLARRTPIPIRSVENGMQVERDAIYLLPPRREMIIAEGKLLLTDKDPGPAMTMPIDHFFRSLAQDCGKRSVAVILSGTGSDGSRGIREVHDAGGLVLVQKPETAKFDGMPNSAEKTGVVDFLLSPEEMPQVLVNHVRKAGNGKAVLHPQAEPIGQEDGMDVLFRLLRGYSGIDFSHYRPTTVLRRTERRLQMHGLLSLPEYIQRLENDPEELTALYRDLLIGVTCFFRDREAFGALETLVLPELLHRARDTEEGLRFWVAGCATGEEAYSLAILVREGLEAAHLNLPVKIFATDVHRVSLELASTGVYPEASLADMSAERRARHFHRKGDVYQVSPELRKLVVFAPHNVIKDAPFTKLDLISCRNLLIYLQPATQKKVLSLFHFGLRTGGALFLGPSESPGELGDEFEIVEGHWKIYRKRRDVRLSADLRLAIPAGQAWPRPMLPPSSVGNGSQFDGLLLGVYDVLLSKYMPPSLLVNERRELVQSFAGANRYLKHREGRYSPDILEMVDPDLRMALTGALQRTLIEFKPVAYKNIRVTLPSGEEQLVNVAVEPIRSPRTGLVHALISLEQAGKVVTAPPPQEEINRSEASREQVRSLEADLRYTKENLQAAIEEMETSNEELQATNEELLASNEELQSTNEELHSVNEELYTVNGEYQKKIAELTELTTDIENLLASTQVHTLFLDRELRIRKFTPRIAETFNLLPQDIGRRIESFTHTMDHPTLMEEIQTVLRTANPVEKQIRDLRGNWFLLRLLPYRIGLAVEGVVLTLIDIGNLKRLEVESRRMDQQLTGILKNSPNPLAIMDLEGRFLVTDQAFQEIVQGDPRGRTARDLFPGQAAEVLTAGTRQVIADQTSVQAEVVIEQESGPRTFLTILFPLQEEHGPVSGVGLIMTDVTPLKRAESRALEAVTQRDRFLAMLSHELRNPLAAILNSTSALELARKGNGMEHELVRIIDRRAQHMARLLDDLLDVARLTQNKIEIRKSIFDLGTTLDGVIEEVRSILEARRIPLVVRRPDFPLQVCGDSHRLQQIQVNLLLNAAKYTPEGGHVWYTVGREEDQAVIRVRDDGMGIAPDMLDQVFDLFVQAENSAGRAGGGIGVGLTMVRSIVQLHGGRVKACSDGPGKGSEFVVWLPLIREVVPVAQPVRSASPRSEIRVLGCNVLLVEDDHDIRDTLRSVLEHDGFRVQAAPDGPTALTLLEKGLPSVALVDLGLPGMSGFELARAIRQRYGSGGPRLVALTGYGQAADRQASREAGFDAHLTKPLKPRDLYQTLNSLLASDTSPKR